MIQLGVNIDHVATLRQARGTRYPSPAQAALVTGLKRELELLHQVPAEAGDEVPLRTPHGVETIEVLAIRYLALED